MNNKTSTNRWTMALAGDEKRDELHQAGVDNAAGQTLSGNRRREWSQMLLGGWSWFMHIEWYVALCRLCEKLWITKEWARTNSFWYSLPLQNYHLCLNSKIYWKINLNLNFDYCHNCFSTDMQLIILLRESLRAANPAMPGLLKWFTNYYKWF